MVYDDYTFSAFSALFNNVNNSIFIRDGVANKITGIYKNNQLNKTIRNEHRLKKIIFDEVMNKYNARIRDHNLNFHQLSNSDIDNMEIIQFVMSDRDNELDSGSYMAYPRTFRCVKCNDYKVLYTDDWKKFDINKCQKEGCDGHYVQVSILGFCETCGNVDTMRKSCPDHHYEALEIVQDDKESVSSWKIRCRKCGWEKDFKSYPCNHINKFIFGNERISNEPNTPFTPINVQRGGLFQSCVKTTVDIPSTKKFKNDSQYIDEIIIGNYLNLFQDFGFEKESEVRIIQQLLKQLETYPTQEDRDDAISLGFIPEETFNIAERLKEKILDIRENFEEYSIPDIVDYLILKEFISTGNNKSYNEFYSELNDNLSLNDYADFKESFGISDIIHIPDIQLISTSYGSISGINKFYDLDFTPHFEPHWINSKTSKREKFGIYAYPFETEGIMFDLDKIKLANWVLDNSFSDENHFTSIDDAKSFLFNLDEDSKEYENLYTLVHSFSHVLIKRSSLYTGLDSDSCSELLFPKSGAFMIYSTSNINIGGFSFVFENSLMDWFNNVKLDINECVLDPSCIEEIGACFSCMYLPEYVCCRFNQKLDRDVFLGEYRYNKGFWEF